MSFAARLLALLFLLAASPAASRIQPSQFSSFAFRQHPGAALPLDARLVDEKDQPVRLGQYFHGKPAIVVMEYLRCPNLCGLVLGGITAQMKQQGLRPGRDLQFIAVSIDPQETAADARCALSDYTGQFGAGSTDGWHFLRGSAAEVGRVAKAIGFPYQYDPSIGQYAHPAGYIVATPDGRIAQYLLGPSQPAGKLKTAVAGAAAGATKPPAYPLLCLCLGYDPQPGTVQAIVLNIVRDVSLALAAAFALFIAFLALKRRTA